MSSLPLVLISVRFAFEEKPVVKISVQTKIPVQVRFSARFGCGERLLDREAATDIRPDVHDVRFRSIGLAAKHRPSRYNSSLKCAKENSREERKDMQQLRLPCDLANHCLSYLQAGTMLRNANLEAASVSPCFSSCDKFADIL